MNAELKMTQEWDKAMHWTETRSTIGTDWYL